MKSLILFITILINIQSVTFKQASTYYKNKEYSKSFAAYKELAEKGNINAQYNLGILYYNGIGTVKDKVNAFIWLSTAAQKNHKVAQNKLGYMYEKSEIPALKDIPQAIREYYKSAKQDYDLAQLNLGMHFNNSLDDASYKRAFFWYTKAMNNGNVAAMNNIANMYYFGQGIKKSYKMAANLYLKAAKLGDKLAQYNLSMMYYSGEHFKKNGDLSFYWLKESAKQNYSIAQIKLANFYKEGNNSLVNKDHKKALYWYFKAAKQNYAPAQYYVGYYYFKGFAIKKDLKMAAYWMSKAKKNKYNNAAKFMKRHNLKYYE
jgi:TPR repeat protein